MGAVGWVAGLVNALPRESVDLFNYAMNGEREKAIALYNWFLPLLRMDTVPKFVQLIKLVQQEVGMGNARVRPPRLELAGAELEEALKTIRHALNRRQFATKAQRHKKEIRFYFVTLRLCARHLIRYTQSDVKRFLKQRHTAQL